MDVIKNMNPMENNNRKQLYQSNDKQKDNN